MKYKLGDTVKTTKDVDAYGDAVFPIGTVGVIAEVDENSEFHYKVSACNDFWWYSEDMLEPCKAKTYEQGLKQGQNEAWELARKIFTSTIGGGLTKTALTEIFGVFWIDDIMKNHTYQEAFAKYDNYMKQQSEIKVGDGVEAFGKRGIVVCLGRDNTYSIVHTDGTFSVGTPKELIKKTGKHIDISSILAEIGKE